MLYSWLEYITLFLKWCNRVLLGQYEKIIT